MLPELRTGYARVFLFFAVRLSSVGTLSEFLSAVRSQLSSSYNCAVQRLEVVSVDEMDVTVTQALGRGVQALLPALRRLHSSSKQQQITPSAVVTGFRVTIDIAPVPTDSREPTSVFVANVIANSPPSSLGYVVLLACLSAFACVFNFCLFVCAVVLRWPQRLCSSCVVTANRARCAPPPPPLPKKTAASHCSLSLCSQRWVVWC